jgi:hypothetical protein
LLLFNSCRCRNRVLDSSQFFDIDQLDIGHTLEMLAFPREELSIVRQDDAGLSAMPIGWPGCRPVCGACR